MSNLAYIARGFFGFAIFTFFVALFSVLVYGGYNSYLYYKDDACGYMDGARQTHYCGDMWKFIFSRGNSVTYQADIEKALYLGLYGVLVIIQIIYLMRVSRIRAERKAQNLSIKHLSLHLYHLPIDVTKKEVADYFANYPIANKQREPLPLRIVAISFIYTDTDYVT